MNRILLLMLTLALSLPPVLCWAAEPNADKAKAGGKLGEKVSVDKKTPDKPLCCFTAKVKWIELVGQWEGKAVPIGAHIDMNWLAGLDILSIEKPDKAFDKKGERVLIIHSPVLFFGQSADEVIGKQYSFKVFGETKGGIPRYTYAEVKEKKSSEKK